MSPHESEISIGTLSVHSECQKNASWQNNSPDLSQTFLLYDEDDNDIGKHAAHTNSSSVCVKSIATFAAWPVRLSPPLLYGSNVGWLAHVYFLQKISFHTIFSELRAASRSHHWVVFRFAGEEG